ncbi:NAD(P)H-binding protein [Brevibacillus sp. DP1.3A]|uniref:NAD(P)H-binding protein n=1 Tax=Brevibacillus sp. DP1.3A TaxID=2738867 RepID=UPI001D161996|nr:NAD(P)H-binding protein [Brevibacillus sp. DP1.3A]UED76138.1 NAD(P)H-binding protein [Brevibacillus sp. DP1.3A]
MKRAVLFGATGLVGRALLQLLLEDDAYGKVIAVVRNELPFTHPRLQTVVIDFRQLGDCRPFLEGADIYCCLGTTMKKAGSREAFRKVDYQCATGTPSIGRARCEAITLTLVSLDRAVTRLSACHSNRCRRSHASHRLSWTGRCA